MKMTKLGAACWLLGLLTLPAQIVVAMHWPQGYSLTHNLISDLGVTQCGTFDLGTRVERAICSPWHPLANAATVVNGFLIAVGSVLLWSSWPRPLPGRTAMLLMGIGGILVVFVGLLPWDLDPEGHNAAALLQAFFQWAGMIVLVFAVRGSKQFRYVLPVTVTALVISIAGFAAFMNAAGGGDLSLLGIGFTERVAFDSLTLWAAVLGCILVRLSSGAVKRPLTLEEAL